MILTMVTTHLLFIEVDKTKDFNGKSSSEGFVRMGSVNDPKGAVAAIGTSTTGTHTAYNNIVNMGLYEGLQILDLNVQK